jgi:hypothetical protein
MALWASDSVHRMRLNQLLMSISRNRHIFLDLGHGGPIELSVPAGRPPRPLSHHRGRHGLAGASSGSFVEAAVRRLSELWFWMGFRKTGPILITMTDGKFLRSMHLGRTLRCVLRRLRLSHIRDTDCDSRRTTMKAMPAGELLSLDERSARILRPSHRVTGNCRDRARTSVSCRSRVTMRLARASESNLRSWFENASWFDRGRIKAGLGGFQEIVTRATDLARPRARVSLSN